MALIIPIFLVIGLGVICGGVLSMFHKDNNVSNWLILPKSIVFVAALVMFIVI